MQKTRNTKTTNFLIDGQNGDNSGEVLYIKSFYKKKNYLYIISPHNWLNIIDFLNYKELREAGKMNRYTIILDLFLFFRTMNYLVKNSKILMKFFTNKTRSTKNFNKLCEAYRSIGSNGSFLAKEKLGDGVNISIIGNNTVISLPSFNNYKERNSLYSQKIENSSNSQHSSSGHGHGINSMKSGTLYSGSKFLTSSNNGLTIKSTGPGDTNNELVNNNNNNNNTIINNNTTNNQTLSLFINNQPGYYNDLFSQNEIDWNIVKRDMIHNDGKSSYSGGDHTPSFNSYKSSVNSEYNPSLFYHSNKGYNKNKTMNLNLQPNSNVLSNFNKLNPKITPLQNIEPTGTINKQNLNSQNTVSHTQKEINTTPILKTTRVVDKKPQFKTVYFPKSPMHRLNTIQEENKGFNMNNI
jgi:hypothetical protein